MKFFEMLEKFNKNINFIILESFEVSPKYIDKEYQCTYNKIDLFTSKKFFKGSNTENTISQTFIELLLKKIKINNIKKEKRLIIYMPQFSNVYSAIISPTHANRHEIILLNSWKSERIPPIETTGQERVIL